MQNMQGMRERGEGGCCCLVVEFLNCTIGICKICKVGGGGAKCEMILCSYHWTIAKSYFYELIFFYLFFI